MKLLELEPRFLRYVLETADEHRGRRLPDGTTQWGGFPIDTFHNVESLSEADRIMFLCPLCFTRNSGPVGTHGIAIDFVGRATPDSACMRNDQKQPVRWNATGNSLEDLTLTPSILILSGCQWHGFVTNGEIVGGL